MLSNGKIHNVFLEIQNYVWNGDGYSRKHEKNAAGKWIQALRIFKQQDLPQFLSDMLYLVPSIGY